MGEEARESIANAYADLRTKADDRTLPVLNQTKFFLSYKGKILV